MNLLFLRTLKRRKTEASANAVATATAVRVEKPASERFSKTVTPNLLRGFNPQPARNTSPSSSLPNPTAAPVSMPGWAPPASGSKTISLGGNGAQAAAQAAPSAAFAVPAAERTVALRLAEIIPQIPADLLQVTEVDPEQRVLLKASEIERGMADGRPTVLLRAVYQQVPDIFKSDVSATDPREVPLPFAKVLEQFVSYNVRADQLRDPAAPQVETPFLKVTIEDSERFGTPLPPLQPSEAEPAPPPKIAPLAPIRLSVPKESKEGAAGSSVKAPIRLDPIPPRPPIALKIPPNGTGVPATERVPASGGPPVPTLPVPAPARILFK